MKLAFIPPTNLNDLEYVRKGQIAMALTQVVLSNPDYAKFYRKLKMFKILDNGCYEDSLCSLDQVLEAAELIKADEVILPDVACESKETIEATEGALATLRKKRMMKAYRWFAVPQGANREDWWDCFIRFNRNSSINTIGLSKLSCPVAYNLSITDARLEITNAMVKLGVISNKKEYHLLGGSHEILTEAMMHPGFVRSIDTSAPFEYAKNGKLLGKAKGDLKGKAKLEEPLQEKDLKLVDQNISLLLQRASV